MKSLKNSFAAWKFGSQSSIKFPGWLDNHLVLWHYFCPSILQTLVHQEMFVHCSCTKENNLTGKEGGGNWWLGNQRTQGTVTPLSRQHQENNNRVLLLISVARGACVKDRSSITFSILFLAWSCRHNPALNSALPCSYSVECVKSLCLFMMAYTYISLYRQ